MERRVFCVKKMFYLGSLRSMSANCSAVQLELTSLFTKPLTITLYFENQSKQKNKDRQNKKNLGET